MNEEALKRRVKGIVLLAAAVITAVVLAANAYIVVPEGHVAVIKRFTQAHRQVGAGLNLKIPYFEDDIQFDIREQRTEIQLAAISKDRLAFPALITYNWRPIPERVMEIFVIYGSPEQYLERKVLPAMHQSAKEAIAAFGVEELIERRDLVSQSMNERLASRLTDFPIRVTDGIIANVSLPQRYIAQTEEKNIAREAVEREELNLQQQKIKAQQIVQTEQAKADALRIAADAKLYQRQKEAEGLALVGRQIAVYPTLPDYIRAQGLADGNYKLPQVMGGDGLGLILNQPKDE